MVFRTFAVLTLLAAGTLLLLAGHTDRYFAWTIAAEPMGSFFGSAYAAGFVLSVLALRQDRWERIRVALVTVAVFTVLTLIPTLIHLHVLHLASGDPIARFAAWFWLLVYLAIPVVCLVAVAQQRAHMSEPVRRPMPLWLTALLAGQGLIMLIVGLVLYSSGATVHHFSPSALPFWPWPIGPLSAQVAGAWLIALAIAAGLIIRERDLDRLFVPAATYTAFGGFQLLVTLHHWAEVRPDTQWAWAYIAALALITLTGAYGMSKAAEATHRHPSATRLPQPGS